jgi:hypothetical protein
MNEQHSNTESRHRPLDLLAKYGITKHGYYTRLKFLGIKSQRGADRKSYLTEEQVSLLDALDQHIKTTGKMEGFPHRALVLSDDELLGDSTEEYFDLDVDFEDEEIDQFSLLVRSAQEYAAGIEIAKYSLVKEIQNNPELLPEDLRRQIEQAKKSVIPKYQNAQSIAEQYLAKMRECAA